MLFRFLTLPAAAALALCAQTTAAQTTDQVLVVVNKQWRSLGQGDQASLRARKAGLVPALDHEP